MFRKTYEVFFVISDNESPKNLKSCDYISIGTVKARNIKKAMQKAIEIYHTSIYNDFNGLLKLQKIGLL